MDKNKQQEKSPKKKEKRNKEKLTIRELEDIMNMHVDTYRRGRGGAIRRK